MLQVVPFFDAGGDWYKGRPTPDPQVITSAGLGLRFDPHRRVHAELYWGKAFKDDQIDELSSGLQADGWSFVLNADVF
jgi:hemolysin activation/secretion protein